MSFVPPFVGSIRATACLRRYAREYTSVIKLDTEREALIDSVSVIQPKVAEGEEAPEPITVDDVLLGGVKARIRVGNAFGSVAKVNAKLEYISGEIISAQKVMGDCHGNLKSMIGGKADKLIAKARRNIDG